MATLHYDKVSEARDNFKSLLDAAERGLPATIRRDEQTAAVVDAARLRYFLARMAPKAEVVPDAGSWWVFLPGLPISADGESLDEAITETIDALREYSDDWQDHLFNAPNHENNWGLVQLVSLSTDDELREWLSGSNS